jgi:hypothetical protein
LHAAATFLAWGTDKEFAAKAADVVRAYLSPLAIALVISVGEKPSIQALERATGYLETDNGTIVHGFESTRSRHGSLNLVAALQEGCSPDPDQYDGSSNDARSGSS